MIDTLRSEPRLILRAKLKPVAGSSFQPTGFPDLGPAEFERPGAERGTEKAILVESVQSLANRLEDERLGHGGTRNPPTRLAPSLH